MQDQKVPREVVLAIAYDRFARFDFSRTRDRIQSGSRALFLPNDPNLFTFHQGRLGDCYLLSAIAAFLNRDPRVVRAMIKPKPGNAFEITFASGRKIPVSFVTDAELVLGVEPDSNHGTWLVTLEKAYAAIRQEGKTGPGGLSVKANDVVLMDLLDLGGPTGQVIEHLTGHQAASELLIDDSTAKAVEPLHKRLSDLSRNRRLCIASTQRDTGKPLSKGIIHQHAIAVIGYDEKRRVVRLFNPWGNEVAPAGSPGLVNGYVTHNGHFEVLLTEIARLFIALSFETDRPFSLRPAPASPARAVR